MSLFSIVVADRIELEDGCVIEPFNFIFHPRSFFMGERSRISAFTRIVGYGDFIMKSQSFIALSSLIDCTTEFTLGERSQIGPRSTCYTHGSNGLIFNMRYLHKANPRIRIGRDTWLGMACVVYPGVEIGEEAVIFAGTVVSRNVKARTMLMPSTQAYITTETDHMQAFVDDAAIIRYMEELLDLCGNILKRKNLNVLQENVGVLECEDRNKIILIKQKWIRLDLSGFDRNKTVVWRLDAQKEATPIPTFEFEILTIKGGRTPLASKIAAILCERVSTHFVFDKTEGIGH